MDLIARITGGVNGLHYTEVISDESGVQVSKMLFTPESRPVIEVWDYLEYLRADRLDRFNTLKRICEDLAHFYDFVRLMELAPERLNRLAFSNFIRYLALLQPNPDKNARQRALSPSFPRYLVKGTYMAVERALWRRVPVAEPYLPANRKRVTAIRPDVGMDSKSILRIAGRVVHYLSWLKALSDYRFRFQHLNIAQFYDARHLRSQIQPLGESRLGRSRRFRSAKSVRGFLTHQGITPPGGIQPIEVARIPTPVQMDMLQKQARNPRDQFLYWLLEKKGLRISEALHLTLARREKTGQIMPGPPPLLSGARCRWDWTRIAGDLEKEQEHGVWLIHIRVSKTGPRTVPIEPSLVPVFEALLDAYLVWREGKLRKFKMEDHGHLFVGKTGQRSTYWAVRNQFRRNKAKAGLGHLLLLTLHSLRHFKVTQDRRRGLSYDVISVDTGHTPGTAEKLYTHRTAVEVAKHRDTVTVNLSETEQSDAASD